MAVNETSKIQDAWKILVLTIKNAQDQYKFTTYSFQHRRMTHNSRMLCCQAQTMEETNYGNKSLMGAMLLMFILQKRKLKC